MQFSAVTLLLFIAISHASASTTNPVAKVLDMISGLQAKILSEGESDQKAYEDFSEWCEDTSKTLAFEIDTGRKTSADLKATIAKETANQDALNTKIEQLAESIATDSADLTAATQVRNKEHADFAAEENDLTEAVDTLQRATAILEREMQKGGAAAMLQVKNAGSLVQALSALVQASALDSADAKRLTALVQSSDESQDGESDDAPGAPDASVYEGHSGNILDTLGDLLETAQSQLADARNKEQIALHNFQMLRQSLNDQIKLAERDTARAKKAMAESQMKKAAAEGDLEITSKDVAEDLTSQSNLHQDCMSKAEDFQATTKSRGEELTALATAKKVIDEATSGATSQTYGLAQVSFLQIGRATISSTTDLVQFEAVRYIRDLSIKENSPALAQLASRMATAMRLNSGSGDPFEKVKGLLSDMLDRLTKEAAADATQESYCDKEMAESRDKEADLKSDISKLSTKLDQMSARSAKLKEEVSALQNALLDLAKEQAEMSSMRAKENNEFKKFKPEMEMGLEGIKKALQVLRSYYAIDDKAHSASDAGSGIISLLEVCESDFSKGLAEMVATEENAALTYERETKQNVVEKVTKQKDVEYKTKEHVSLDKAVAQATSDRSGLQTELDAVWEYIQKLDDMCIAKPDTYAVKKARRDAELAGLKEALKILEAQSLLQKRKRITLRGSRRHAEALA